MNPQHTSPDPVEQRPHYSAIEAEMRRDLARIHAIRGYLDTETEQKSPTTCVMQMTQRQHQPEEVWSQARQASADFRVAFRRQREAIRKSGEWNAYWKLLREASRAVWCLGWVYAAALLHRLHLVGVLDLRKEEQCLLAWR